MTFLRFGKLSRTIIEKIRFYLSFRQKIQLSGKIDIIESRGSPVSSFQ